MVGVGSHPVKEGDVPTWKPQLPLSMAFPMVEGIVYAELAVQIKLAPSLSI